MRTQGLAAGLGLVAWMPGLGGCADSGGGSAGQTTGTASVKPNPGQAIPGATMSDISKSASSPSSASPSASLASTSVNPSVKPSATTGSQPSTQMGSGALLGACSVFPSDNPWNQDVSQLPVHAQSSLWVNSIGSGAKMHPDFGTEWEGAPIGIPYVLVSGTQKRVPVEFEYAEESEPGPYPIPKDAPIEGGPDAEGDRHVLVVDTDQCVLYELFAAYPKGEGWTAGSGAVFDLKSNALRPDGWTSADAAGLPILPGLVRYDEVAAGEILHALRFTVSRSQRAYIKPATHFASDKTDSNLPPMGARFRLKANYDCGKFSNEAKVVCTALKRFGMFLADNGSNWYLSGAHDSRWDDEALNDLKTIPGSAFEALETGPLVTK